MAAVLNIWMQRQSGRTWKAARLLTFQYPGSHRSKSTFSDGSASAHGRAIEDLDLMKHKVNDCFVADLGIQHHVVEVPLRPYPVEVLFDEGGALPVDSFDQLLGFVMAFALRDNSADLLVVGRVHEH